MVKIEFSCSVYVAYDMASLRSGTSGRTISELISKFLCRPQMLATLGNVMKFGVQQRFVCSSVVRSFQMPSADTTSFAIFRGIHFLQTFSPRCCWCENRAANLHPPQNMDTTTTEDFHFGSLHRKYKRRENDHSSSWGDGIELTEEMWQSLEGMSSVINLLQVLKWKCVYGCVNINMLVFCWLCKGEVEICKESHSSFSHLTLCNLVYWW